MLLGILLAIVVVSGTAFAFTYGSTLAWQQRDQVSVNVDSYELVDGGETMEVQLTVQNPLNRAIDASSISLAVYPNEPPYPDDSEVTDPRGALIQSEETTIGSQSETTLTIRTPVKDGRLSEARAALSEGRLSASGSITMELLERRFTIDVQG